MHIVHIITSLKVGGAEMALYNHLAHPFMRQHKHTVLYIHDGPIRKKIEKLSIFTQKIGGLFHSYDPIIGVSLISSLKKLKPDIIHTALWSANILGRLAGKFLGIPVISDMHGQPSKEGWVRNTIERLTCGLSQKIIAVSASVASDYQKTIGRACCTIPNGIDIKAFKAMPMHNTNNSEVSRKMLGLSQSDFVVGAVGRLEPIKSYDRLIRACGHLREILAPEVMKKVKICLVGDGSQRAQLEQLCRDLCVSDSIIFAGQQAQPALWYGLFDCFALSSESEGLSIALLEALVFELAIVTTHESMQHDVIEHERHGLLVVDKDPRAFAVALARLINNPELVSDMRKNNREHVRLFDLAKTLGQYNNEYERLLREHKNIHVH